MTTDSNNEPQEPQWKVKTRHDWDVLYQESVVYFWNQVDKRAATAKHDIDLYDIYLKMGVSNITSIDAPKQNNSHCKGVIILGVNEQGQTNASQEMLKVVPHVNDNGFCHGMNNPNGWKGLTSTLTIKLPNCVLVGAAVYNLVNIIDKRLVNRSEDSLASETVAINDQTPVIFKMTIPSLLATYKALNKHVHDYKHKVGQLMANALQVEQYVQKQLSDETITKLQPIFAQCDATPRQNEIDAIIKNIIDIVLAELALDVEFDSTGFAVDVLSADIENLERIHATALLKDKVEAALYEPLTVLLSSYISLGMYFPFGLDMDESATQASQQCRAGLKNNIIDTLFEQGVSEDLNQVLNAIDHFHDNYDAMRNSALILAVLNAVVFVINKNVHSNFSNPLIKYGIESLTNKFKVLVDRHLPSHFNENRNALSPGDRGGASGESEDYTWEYFIPRVIAYNWHSMSGGGKEKDVQVIKNNTALLDYKTMLYNLGYVPPEFVDIHFDLVDELPFSITLKQDKHDYNANNCELTWNYKAYTPELVIDYPLPPNGQARPMALSDLFALRANQPFTSM